MLSTKSYRASLIRLVFVLGLCIVLCAPRGFCQDTEDSQIFITGFNAYQQRDFATTIAKMDEVLKKHPDTTLRDMALFWLARAHFKSGHSREAARVMSQFTKEYPDSPLKNTVEDDLLTLAARYDRGESLPASVPPGPSLEEQQRLAKLQADEKRKVAAKAEQERLAKLKAEQERVAAEKAELQRREEEKIRLAEAERQAKLKAEEERRAAAKAEQERLAKLKAEQERIAAEKAELQRREVEKIRLVEAERQAKLKAEEERKGAAKAEQERLAKLKAEQERIAAEKAELQRREVEKIRLAEAERLAKLKAEEERKGAAKAEQERLAKLKAEQERIAAERAELQRRAEEKIRLAEAERLAKLKAEEERKGAAKAEEERKGAAKAEQERLAKLKAEQDRIAAEKAELQRREVEKIRLAEAERQAKLKAEEKRRAAAKVEQEHLAKLKAEQDRVAAEKTERQRSDRAQMREKAIEQYKLVIQKYPHSKAARTAAEKLRKLGVAQSELVATTSVSGSEIPDGNQQVYKLEITQFADLDLKLGQPAAVYEVARTISIPFEITNKGNGDDAFDLESGFPGDYASNFTSSSTPDVSLSRTPVLPPGQTFRGIIRLAIPASSVDGLRIMHPIKAASRFTPEATQSREIRLTAAAPLLRAIMKTDKTRPAPGERLSYRIVVLNVGSLAARDINLRLSYPPQLEPVEPEAAGFRQDGPANLVSDGIGLASGESREIPVTFRLKDDTLADQELLCHVGLFNNRLKTGATFVSNAATVKATHNILVRARSERLVVIPGQTVNVPFIVANTGNIRETLTVTPDIKGVDTVAVFHDLNRDGIRQDNEPLVTETGPLEPREEINLVMEVHTSKTTPDLSRENARLLLKPRDEASRPASATTVLAYSRPVLRLAMSGGNDRLKPGAVASFDLTITNHGSNLARVVDLRSSWPEQLEFVASEPASSSSANSNILWQFKELGAGEKRSIKVSFRVREGLGVGANVQVTNVLNYEDQSGNRY